MTSEDRDRRRFTSREAIILSLAAICAAAAFGMAFLPTDWIEAAVGFEPDGGSGSLEVAAIVAPALVSLILVVAVLRARMTARASAGGAGARA